MRGLLASQSLTRQESLRLWALTPLRIKVRKSVIFLRLSRRWKSQYRCMNSRVVLRPRLFFSRKIEGSSGAATVLTAKQTHHRNRNPSNQCQTYRRDSQLEPNLTRYLSKKPNQGLKAPLLLKLASSLDLQKPLRSLHLIATLLTFRPMK